MPQNTDAFREGWSKRPCIKNQPFNHYSVKCYAQIFITPKEWSKIKKGYLYLTYKNYNEYFSLCNLLPLLI